MSEAARSRRDDARQEPQVGTPGRDGAVDPLAELARLVGQEDPFGRVFRPAPALAERDGARGQEAAEPVYGDNPGDQAYEGGYDPDGADEYAGHESYGHPDAYRGPEAYHAPHGHDDHDYAAEQAYAAEHAPYGDEAGIADAHLADEAAVAALPDMWARGEDGGFAPDGDAAMPPDPRGRSSARRPLAVLLAVLVLTGGGLAASFLAKAPGSSSSASGTSGRTAPTIMAATSPIKVKVEDPQATAPEDQDAALLNKNANLSSGPVKIVSSQEQPADLSQLPKTPDLAAGARPLPQPTPSPFPEPKRVKTFVVHPDGTMLSEDGAPVPAADPARPSTPKADASGATATPSSTPASASASAPAAAPVAPTTVASLAADAGDAAKVRQPASAGARTAATKPSDVAEAPSGGYGLQLASTPAEADAQAAFGKLKKKYPALLGSLSATIHRAETGDKPVYRVRVGGMSQDAAKALCAKLQGAGGSCFVVHN